VKYQEGEILQVIVSSSFIAQWSQTFMVCCRIWQLRLL